MTVLKVDHCQVVAVRTDETTAITPCSSASAPRRSRTSPRPQRGHFAKAKVEPKKKLAEFRVSKENLLEVGAELSAEHFVVGQFVDVVGTTIGRRASPAR